MYRFLKFSFLFFSFFWIVSCQLNDTLTKIRENITININDGKDIVVKQEEENKNIKKSKSQKKQEYKNLNLEKPKTQKELVKKKEKIDKNIITLVQPKIQTKKIREIEKKKIVSKEIGLLFPMTGKDAKLGQNLINSVRFYLDTSETKVKFKVFDTKSSEQETLNALKEGLSYGINIYIGPVFSHEALYIKEFAKKNDALIFSFSTDKNAISKNIIITGLSLEDEVNCLAEYSRTIGQKSIGVVINNDKYGNLLKETLENLNLTYTDLEFSFLRIGESINLDDEIRRFSHYEQRKKNLDIEIGRINSLELEEKEKSTLIDQLQKKETFGNAPYDMIIIGESGSKLIEILALFAFYDIDTGNTNFFGTSIWEGVEKFKENVLDKTYYATSLVNNKTSYNKSFILMFSEKPNDLSYIVSDLLGFLEKNINDEQELKINTRIYEGMFSKSKINELGYFQRNIEINEIDRDKVNTVHNCPLLPGI